jgi:hypothetical protein
MHSLDLDHPSWYRALTLTERLESLRQDRPATRDVAVDAGRAERRLRRWRDQDPFATDGFFARRLAADAMNEDDLWRLLGEPIEAVRDRSPAPPHWLLELCGTMALELHVSRLQGDTAEENGSGASWSACTSGITSWASSRSTPSSPDSSSKRSIRC